MAYRKVRNSRIGVDKLVGKASINLLRHTKFISHAKSAACVIRIIINGQSIVKVAVKRL